MKSYTRKMFTLFISILMIITTICGCGETENDDLNLSNSSQNGNSNSLTNNNGLSSIESAHEEENAVYKIYYIVNSGIVGIMGFDDGISNSDVSAMNEDLQLSGYSVDYIEIKGKNDIVIPTHINGCCVYAIDGGAFKNCTSITSITIPSCVEVIEPGAFDGCNKNLTIYGDMNSTAQSFANENGICFKQQ